MASVHLHMFTNHLDRDFLWREMLHVQQHREMPRVGRHLRTARLSSDQPRLPGPKQGLSPVKLTLASETGESPFLLVAMDDLLIPNN